MIVIYNLKGALIAIAGLTAGIFLFAVTSSLTLGVIAVVGVWCYFGRGGIDENTGEKKVAGQVFFIPVVYWGILFGVLGLPIGALFDLTKGARSEINRNSETGVLTAEGKLKQQFLTDEKGLKTDETDDPGMSEAITAVVSSAFPDSERNIRVKSSEDSVLILIQMPDLKRIDNDDRTLLLELVRGMAETVRPDVKVYAGLKGRVVYGAIAVPDAEITTGKVESDRPLHEFYKQPEGVERQLPEADETVESLSDDPEVNDHDPGEDSVQ